MNEYHYTIGFLSHFPPLIQMVWIASFVILLHISILTIYLKYLRSRLRLNQKLEAKYKESYESSLITFIYSGEEDGVLSLEQKAIIEDLKSGVSNSFKRKILTKTLIKLRNEISGEVAESIDKLYVELGLLPYTLSKLRNRKWDVVAKAIKELTQFQVKEIHDIIMNSINHPKKEVRKEMQLYLVQLFTFKGLDFLNVLETSLSEWDQIQLLEILQRSEDQNITDIKPWLKSTNDSVVTFALKLAKIYNQYEVKDEIIELLNHKMEEIRVNAIESLSQLNVFEAKKILKSNFNKTSIDEQIAIVKMIDNTYESTDKSFLLEHRNHENKEIKILILEIMKNMNFEDYNIHNLELLESSNQKKLTA